MIDYVGWPNDVVLRTPLFPKEAMPPKEYFPYIYVLSSSQIHNPRELLLLAPEESKVLTANEISRASQETVYPILSNIVLQLLVIV